MDSRKVRIALSLNGCSDRAGNCMAGGMQPQRRSRWKSGIDHTVTRKVKLEDIQQSVINREQVQVFGHQGRYRASGRCPGGYVIRKG
ncbi:hypothetical protein D3C72_2349430 [compost metagenome]